ncbi:MAG: hypothetical protein HRT90_04910 [Candidatus Margulisbacteria bacterium]|nr:hypothetical protein [Candidatus Margulisiibacteriota bacterium]
MKGSGFMMYKIVSAAQIGAFPPKGADHSKVNGQIYHYVQSIRKFLDALCEFKNIKIKNIYEKKGINIFM